MAMEFERAIEEATTLFLFDRRSQQRLQEMAEDAPPRSRDRYIIMLTQAAFAYYNTADADNVDMGRTIGHAMSILREVKRYREDRVFFTLAMRLEVDLLLHQSKIAFQDALPRDREAHIFNEEDARALSICETLLKNFPPTFEPLPDEWYSGVIPLFPPYKDQVIEFYQDRNREHRIAPLTDILKKVKGELVLLNGMILAKKFLREYNVKVRLLDRVPRYLHATVAAMGRYAETHMPQEIHFASDIAPPRNVSHSDLEMAVDTVEHQMSASKGEHDIRKYTQNLLQVGILNYLQNKPDDAIYNLVRTLKASARISPEDKKVRQYRHEEFADIPFMIGTSFLRSLSSTREVYKHEMHLLENAVTGLCQAIKLQPHYHQAYVNLLIAYQLDGDEPEQKALLRLYLREFGHDIAQLSNQYFTNKAYMDWEANHRKMTPDILMWLLLSEFCGGGDLTKGKQMLQELKTLYILNGHTHSVKYLETYRTHFRMKDEEFIADLEDDKLHSALLFFIAHGFGSLALLAGRQEGEVVVDYDNLRQSIELNSESLYFNRENASARRLIETQSQIIQFAMQRTAKRWEGIKQNMGQRFQFYEDYLRQDKCAEAVRKLATDLEIAGRLPPMQIPKAMLASMHSLITTEQRERLKQRVDAT